MGLFQRKRFVWYEPWFFQQRIRSTKSWVLFSLLLFGVAVGVAALLFFSRQNKPLHPLEILGLSLAVAAALWWVMDGTNIRRQAILFEDSIVVGGDMGKYSAPDTYKLSKIAGAAIVMPEESKWPSPALFFIYGGEEEAIGIESKSGLKRLAQAIHDAGVPVRLAGWRPNEDREFERAFAWQADPRRVVNKATMETLPPGTASMMSVGGILLAMVRQSWAIVLWLLITAGAIYYGYQNWQNLGVIEFGLLFLIPLGVMYLAGDYTDRFASASTTQGLIRMAKNQFRKRPGIQLDPNAEDLIPVEVFTRDQFGKTIERIREMGFLQADPRGQRVLFEGKKERWTIPASSIQSLAIEEVQVGTPGQSAMGALNYYVVMKFDADENQELGFRNSQRDYGKFDDVKRAEGGIRVFELIEKVLPLQ